MASFFEKLTGTSQAPREVADVRRESEPEPEESQYEISTAATRSSVASRKEKKDWSLPQTEGQLTVDIFDKGDHIIIQSAVAGTDPKDLDITLTHDMITIKGARTQSDEITEDNYYYRELYWGTFSRSIILPEEIDEDKCEASIKNGILTIKLLKKHRPRTQKIKIDTQ